MTKDKLLGGSSPDLFIGKKAQRGSVPGQAAGLLEEPKSVAPTCSLPCSLKAPSPTTGVPGLPVPQAPAREVLPPQIADPGPFTQAHIEPASRSSPRAVEGSRKPSPLLVRNSKHPGTSGLGNQTEAPPGQRMLVKPGTQTPSRASLGT